MVIDWFVLLAVKKKDGKREIVGEERMIEMPDDPEIERIIGKYQADSAVVIREYEAGSLPFE